MTWDIDAEWRQSVGYRFAQWTCRNGLTSAEKARDYEKFAAEFDTMPPRWEPNDGWAADMAWLCRRSAMRHRGEDPGPWVPAPERRQAGGAHRTG